MAEIPDDFDEFKMAKLAREMAMAIRPAAAIYADFGIDPEIFYQVQKHEFYKRAKEQFALEWNSTLSAADRVKMVSATAAEQGLPVITRRMLNPNEPFMSSLTAFKQLCQNAGIGDPKFEQKSSERFVITINLGGDDVKTYDKSIAPEGKTIDLIAQKDS
jgi:hypothetical protein